MPKGHVTRRSSRTRLVRDRRTLIPRSNIWTTSGGSKVDLSGLTFCQTVHWRFRRRRSFQAGLSELWCRDFPHAGLRSERPCRRPAHPVSPDTVKPTGKNPTRQAALPQANPRRNVAGIVPNIETWILGMSCDILAESDWSSVCCVHLRMTRGPVRVLDTPPSVARRLRRFRRRAKKTWRVRPGVTHGGDERKVQSTPLATLSRSWQRLAACRQKRDGDDQGRASDCDIRLTTTPSRRITPHSCTERERIIRA